MLLAVAGTAWAVDNVVADSDVLTAPITDQDMSAGSVPCNSPTTKNANIALRHTGGTNNSFADGSTVTITASASGTGLSAQMNSSTITPPSGWASGPTALSPSVSSTVTINPAVTGAAGTVTYTATGREAVTGNPLTRTDTMNVSWTAGSCDTTAPTTTSSATVPNGAGTSPYTAGSWTNKDVTLSLSAQDNTGGSGVKEIRYTTDGTDPTATTGTVYSGPITRTSTTLVKFRAFDNAGNAEAVKSFQVNIDKSAPTITASLDRSANANGWYNEDVTVSFTCSDTGGSGLDSSGCPADVVLGEGENQSVTKSVTDLAGNSASATKSDIDIDKSAPTITASVDRAPNANGWYNDDVTVSFNCSDALSGLASSCPADVVLGEGENQSVTKSVTDLAGNSASATKSDIDIDKSAPTITASVDRAPNANGWYNDDVTVSFNCSDNVGGSGLNSSGCPADVVLGEGENQSVTKSVTDLAGNSASATKSDIDIDKTAPTISASRTAANANGWNNEDVTVDFTCSDTGGSGVDGSCGPDQTLTSEGANQSATGNVTDAAGNTASRTIGSINIDKTAPEVTLGAVSGTAGANGWYISAVTQAFNATDGLSGLVGSANFSKTSTGEGSGVTISSGDVYDKADNTASNSASFDIDLTNPTITASLNPANPASSGWYNAATGAPTVSFNCSDSVSGLAANACPASHTFANGEDQSYSGTVTDQAGRKNTDGVSNIDVDLDAPNAPTATTNPLNPVANSGGFFKDTVSVSYSGSTDVGPSSIKSYTAAQTFNTTGPHNYSGTATDFAGNVSTATTGSVNVDAVAPELTLSGCPTTPVTLNDTKSISFSASDDLNGSGLVGASSGSVSLDTGSVGSKSKTITVEDKVGHSTSKTCSYSVKYGFSGFLQPINDTAHMISLGPDVSTFKAGSTVPVKFYLTDANGNRVQAGNAQWTTPQKGNATNQAVDEGLFTDQATTGTLYKYDATAQQYIYNWSTKGVAGGFYYKIGVKLDDGQTYYTYISLR